MWYWRDDHFVGLLKVAEEADAINDYTLYASYCRLREQGLRKQAFTVLQQFIAQAQSWSLSQRIHFVDWLSDIRYRQPRLYDLMTQPLLLGLIQPVLEAWSHHEPNNPVPFRWLGLWLAQKEAVVHALQIDPYDQPARIHTITEQISHLWNATHHLPHYYIGTAASDIDVVKDVEAQLLYVQDVAVQGRMKEKVEYYQQLIQDWLRFEQEDGHNFLQWCHQHGRTYTWVMAWYYQA